MILVADESGVVEIYMIVLLVDVARNIYRQEWNDFC